MTKCWIYKAGDGYRWRVVASNGKIVAESGEAYTRWYDCKRAWGDLASAVILGIHVEVQKQPRKKSNG